MISRMASPLLFVAAWATLAGPAASKVVVGGPIPKPKGNDTSAIVDLTCDKNSGKCKSASSDNVGTYDPTIRQLYIPNVLVLKNYKDIWLHVSYSGVEFPLGDPNLPGFTPGMEPQGTPEAASVEVTGAGQTFKPFAGDLWFTWRIVPQPAAEIINFFDFKDSHGQPFLGALQVLTKIEAITVCYPQPMPEPNAWLLMVAGIGAVGAAARGRPARQSYS